MPPVNPGPDPVSMEKQKRERSERDKQEELEERVPEKTDSKLFCPLLHSLFPSALAFFAPAHGVQLPNLVNEEL